MVFKKFLRCENKSFSITSSKTNAVKKDFAGSRARVSSLSATRKIGRAATQKRAPTLVFMSEEDSDDKAKSEPGLYYSLPPWKLLNRAPFRQLKLFILKSSPFSEAQHSSSFPFIHPSSSFLFVIPSLYFPSFSSYTPISLSVTGNASALRCTHIDC